MTFFGLIGIVRPIQMYGHRFAMCEERSGGEHNASAPLSMPKACPYMMAQGWLNMRRMPSTNRAYPLALDKKAEFYAKMFRHLNII